MKKLGYLPASFIIPQHRNGTGCVVQILLHCRSVNTLYWKIIKSPQFGVTLYFQSVSAAASAASTMHDDVIKWKHFLRYLPFVWGIHHWPVNSPHKGQWCGALMFSLCCAWINSWVNNREAGDLRRQHTHYDGIVMVCHCRLLPLTWKPFMPYLGQRIYRSEKMYWMTFLWPWPKVTAVASINKNLLLCMKK